MLNVSQLEKLVGNKVEVVPMAIDHVEELYEAGKSSEIWTYLSTTIHTKEDMRLLVENALVEKEKGIEYPFVVVERETNRVVGSTRFLAINHPHKSVEIGWTWYAKDVWRTGVNTETKYLLLKYCFETAGAIRVELKADDRNERSKMAIERIGAKLEGVFRQHRILADGFLRDTAYFSIIDKEWPSVKENFENHLLR